MTTEEKAKAYDEALERARKIHNEILDNEILGFPDQIREIFPELRGSEDERIRKWLADYFSSIKKTVWVHRDITCEQILDWLEKQKEQNGEDEEYTDFTIYHPLKNGSGKYECIPYSFYGSLTSFSEDKDLIDFLRTCFYTKEECEEWIEKQKEQKPVVTHGETYHVDTLGTQQVIAGKMPQKPAEWSEEDEERIQRIYHFLWKNRKGDTDTIYQIEKDADWLKSLRPQPKQKWSGKDWNMLCDICGYISGSGSSSGITKEERTDWLHKLPKRFELQPSWKPSEEQMRALNKVVNGEVLLTTQHESLESLYEQLKKL